MYLHISASSPRSRRGFCSRKVAAAAEALRCREILLLKTGRLSIRPRRLASPTGSTGSHDPTFYCSSTLLRICPRQSTGKSRSRGASLYAFGHDTSCLADTSQLLSRSLH